jgi:hypothetical protein
LQADGNNDRRVEIDKKGRIRKRINYGKKLGREGK